MENRKMNVPKTTQVLVVGGGPAGSYAASALAREGLDVVLMDMSKFPRYHIGESLLPSARHYLRFIGAEEKVASYGFARKPGSAIKLNQFMTEGYTDFVALGSTNNAWNVVRSEFDELLLKHAEECGTKVFTQTRVESFEFEPCSEGVDGDGCPSADCSGAERQHIPGHHSRSYSLGGRSVEFEPLGRPTKAHYTSADGERGDISFDYLVDASGRAGLLSTKYLKNRRFNQSLKNVAIWGYWKGTGMYGKGTDRENAPFFEALSDESGWAWFIPLHNGYTSVGIVMDQKEHGIRSRAASSATSSPLPPRSASSSPTEPSARTHSTLADRYLTFLHLAPGVQELMGENAELVNVVDENGNAPAARSASDFSYSAEEYAGSGWRIVGDAGAFIDPFFSSGVHLAMTGALSAAASICASIRGDCSEREAAAWYSKRVAVSYTRFLVVVLSAYKQIRAQSSNVLTDIDDDNFDKAFALFRPVIQGGAEMGKRLSEDEVQQALDFCTHLFSPTTPEQHESVRNKLRRNPWSTPDVRMELHTVDEGVQASPTPGSSMAFALSERLMDVRAPVVDPSFLKRFLRSRFTFWPRDNLNLDSRADVSASEELPPSPTSTVSSIFSPLFSFTGSPASRSSRSLSSIASEEIPDVGGIGEGGEDEEVKMVLEKVNARRLIHAEHGEGLHNLEEEEVHGLVVYLVKGQLGLVRDGAGDT